MPNEAHFEKLRRFVMSGWSFKLYLFKNLPMGYLAGLRIRELSTKSSLVTIPYKYLTKNPFKSMYFACLAMAAEMASGAISMALLFKTEPKVSMLVRNIEGEFTKKAVGLISFRCNDGEAIQKAVEETKATGEGVTVTATSTGTDETGDAVAIFKVTWSFKAKTTT